MIQAFVSWTMCGGTCALAVYAVANYPTTATTAVLCGLSVVSVLNSLNGIVARRGGGL